MSSKSSSNLNQVSSCFTSRCVVKFLLLCLHTDHNTCFEEIDFLEEEIGSPDQDAKQTHSGMFVERRSLFAAGEEVKILDNIFFYPFDSSRVFLRISFAFYQILS